MTTIEEQTKKSNDDLAIDGSYTEKESDPSSVPRSTTVASLAPRSMGPEHCIAKTALEAILSSQVNSGDTIKAKNLSNIPKPPVHERGVSWDLSVPALAPNDGGNADVNAVATSRPLALNRGTSVPVTAGTAKQTLRKFPAPRPPVVSRKSSNNDGSDGNRSRNTYYTSNSRPLEKPTCIELEATNCLNEIIKQEVRAETNLLRQMDENDPLRPRAGTGTSILSEVPMDEIEHDFVIQDDEGLVLGDTGKKEGSSIDHTSSIPSRRSSSHRQLASTRKVPKSPKERSHKRQMTVEQALFGLTSALSEMKANDEMERHAYGNHHHQKSMESHDLFDVAGALYDRAHKKTVIPGREPVVNKLEEQQNETRQRLGSQDSKAKMNKPTSSKWGAIRTNLANLKKMDGEDIMQDLDTSHKSHHSGNRSGGGDIEKGIPDDDVESNEDFEMDYSADTAFDDSEECPENEQDGRRLRISWIKNPRKANPFKHLPYANKVKEEWDIFNRFLNPRKQTLRVYSKIILMYILIPASFVAAILFYMAENPPYGKCPTEGCNPRKPYPSASWWILFIGCRQVVIACLSKLTETFLIDFLALRTQFTLRLFGPMVTLLLVQARGWPFLVFGFGMYNFALCVGDSPFSNHWLFWQPYIGMFNRANPPGYVTSGMPFYRICAVSMIVGAVVAVKRMAVGIYLGRKTFANYSKSLTNIMNKMLILNELSRFGRALEEQYLSLSKKTSYEGRASQAADKRLSELLDLANQQADDDTFTFSRGRLSRSPSGMDTVDQTEKVIDPKDRDPYTGSLSSHQKQRICDLLGEWEEPVRESSSVVDEVASVGAVMQFKRALAHMDTDFPFGGAFGVADTREACVQCSQKLYERLMTKENAINEVLHFNAIALIAMNRNGDLDTEKTKELIRIFRPDRDGAISLVDFVRAIDDIYKELRLLRATITGSTKIDKALESIFNYGFYVMLTCVILWVLDIDPLALFLSLSSVILAFAFMIGSASSKYFEGLLLIVVQRPYGIGDRINISNPEVNGDTAGSQGWIVEDVTLFTTTVSLAATNERATIANGMLAKSRIINGARSPNAIVYVTMRFGIDTPYRKIELFRAAVEKFVRARPREWSSMLGFRVSRIEADLGFIEYSTALRHREAWQSIVPILNSRNTMHAFCLELAKKLDMRYKKHPLPVDLRMPQQQCQQVPSQFELKFNNEEFARERRQGIGTDPIPNSPGSHPSYNSDSLDQVAAMFDEILVK